jgi:hypothetical protein
MVERSWMPHRPTLSQGYLHRLLPAISFEIEDGDNVVEIELSLADLSHPPLASRWDENPMLDGARLRYHSQIVARIDRGTRNHAGGELPADIIRNWRSVYPALDIIPGRICQHLQWTLQTVINLPEQAGSKENR